MRRPHIWKESHKQNPNHSLQRFACHKPGPNLGSASLEDLRQCGQDLPGLGTTLPSPSPTFQPYLKRSVRKDFSFPDHWQMFAQIYFGGISSTLLSFLCKELEEYFKTTFIFPLSLCLYPSVLPIFFPCPSFCPSFFLDILEFCVDFLCHVMGRLLWPRACSSVLLTLGSLSIHLPCKPEQLQRIQRLPSTNST